MRWKKKFLGELESEDLPKEPSLKYIKNDLSKALIAKLRINKNLSTRKRENNSVDKINPERSFFMTSGDLFESKLSKKESSKNVKMKFSISRNTNGKIIISEVDGSNKFLRTDAIKNYKQILK
mmetsp:Transcript_21038/g.18666  ORF Transcript_21038/g.18666 Transcript_21038/m.18666 type:complete len:123 (+) Transcript_21038:1-369(+)